MKIAVDARELVGFPRGVGRYLQGVLAVWRRDRSFAHEVVLVVPEGQVDGAGLDPGGFAVAVTGHGWLRSGTWWEQAVLPGALKRLGADVVFCPGYTLPLLTRVPAVVVIHDLSFADHREWFSPREGLRRRLLTRLGASRARRILVVSRFVAGRLNELYGVGDERVRVAPLGVSGRFLPRPAGEVQGLARRLGLAGDIVLAVGTVLERRHPDVLIAAFARVARDFPAAFLVMVGDDRRLGGPSLATLAEQHGIAARVKHLAYVAEGDLPALYSLARAAVYLSSYEGFGLPPIEALACGTPVVASRVPSLVESDIDGAVLVDETSAEDVARALAVILARAPGLRLAPAWTARHGWDETAAVALRAIEEVA